MSLLKKAFAKYEKRGQHLQSELGTLEWDTFNPDFLIRIYNMVTFNFLPNPLLFWKQLTVHRNQKQLFQNYRVCILILNCAENFKFSGL